MRFQVGRFQVAGLNLSTFKPSNLLTFLSAWFSQQQKVTDPSTGSGPWTSFQMSGAGPADRTLSDLQADLTDALEAWRRNFLIRQIVRLTTAYVVGDGVTVTSSVPQVNDFLKQFWTHPANQMAARLAAWCDELTRSGELFPVLFTNKFDGMSQVRIIPASCIVGLETAPEDYEHEVSYREAVPGELEPRVWKSRHTARVFGQRADGRHQRPEPMMLHYCVNRPVGATRGEGDLTPLLPWAQRYTEWLKGRVRFNQLRNDLAAVVIELDDDSQVQAKREFYQANPPMGGAVVVTGRGERISFPAANIQGEGAEPDGRALRLAIAAGANVPLHFLAEGSSATRSTAEEMGDPTHRHYRMRQLDFTGFLLDLCTQAWRRYEQARGLAELADLGLEVAAPDISRADNGALATAAKTVVEAFAVMRSNGWIDDEHAVKLAFKFAGEVLPEDEVKKILAGPAQPVPVPTKEGQNGRINPQGK